MYGVIIAAHGSRDSKAEALSVQLVEEIRELLSDAVVEFVFVKRSHNNLGEAFERLDKPGINEIKVLPYFLFEGALVTEIIPSVVDEYREIYKHKKISILKPLGLNKRLAQITAVIIKEDNEQ